MADPVNYLGDYGLGEDFRPRFGSANVGYDMQGAQQHPQPTQQQIMQAGMMALGLIPMGMAGGAGAIGYNVARAAGMGRPASAVMGGAVGAGVADKIYTPYQDSIRDAEGQPGGFYGRR